MKNEEMKKTVLDLLPKNKANAITSRQLMQLTGLSFSGLKRVITELRYNYPICARETNGGGYWIAENKEDIREFIAMIARRRNGYDLTIAMMSEYLLEG